MSVFIMIKTGSVFVFVHVIISCFTIVGPISCTVQPGPHPLWGSGGEVGEVGEDGLQL